MSTRTQRRAPLRYDLKTTGYSATAVRLSDGADVFYQGHEADEIEAQWDACFTERGKIRRTPSGEPHANVLFDDTFACLVDEE